MYWMVHWRVCLMSMSCVRCQIASKGFITPTQWSNIMSQWLTEARMLPQQRGSTSIASAGNRVWLTRVYCGRVARLPNCITHKVSFTVWFLQPRIAVNTLEIGKCQLHVRPRRASDPLSTVPSSHSHNFHFPLWRSRSRAFSVSFEPIRIIPSLRPPPPLSLPYFGRSEKSEWEKKSDVFLDIAGGGKF